MRGRPVVALAIAAFGLAAHAYAATTNITFKQAPATEDERAVAQVMEKLAVEAAEDARGASELYTQDAVVRWFSGPESTEMLIAGRTRIYIILSSATIQRMECRDVTISVAGDRAEVDGHVSLRTSRSTGELGLVNYLREEKRTWKFRREADGWRIYSSDAQNSAETRR